MITLACAPNKRWKAFWNPTKTVKKMHGSVQGVYGAFVWVLCEFASLICLIIIYYSSAFVSRVRRPIRCNLSCLCGFHCNNRVMHLLEIWFANGKTDLFDYPIRRSLYCSVKKYLRNYLNERLLIDSLGIWRRLKFWQFSRVITQCWLTGVSEEHATSIFIIKVNLKRG
jgi:hypothetical protein